MKRRSFASLALFPLFARPALAAERIGVLMLHGKNPGGPASPQYAPVKAAMEKQGWLVSLPDMPWSRNRYLQGHWDGAMAEIAQHVKALQDQGATRIVLMGHSMGVPAAMSHAARGGTAHALVLLAPGHVPQGYFTSPSLTPVRDSIHTARELVAAGKGEESQRFLDINQGRQQPVVTTAKNFLSYFDPESDADMGVTAPKLPPSLPVLTAVGEKDPLFTRVRAYYVDKLPTNPKTQLLEVPGGHLDTPQVALDQVMQWIPQAVGA
ncbi:MAG: alpha/beta hydrolase [Hydrogenophaga sp.]|uniref:alpha/beta hydrolase n=1 Tax=Hydrogenophaga sp. TaxID=1904254 RepID=UPI0025B9A9B1|nr:alpha/beta hydrolase [Hydrogenophaga sp.]MBU7575873.1 alpha/beta hydrolase [Hydrogenophaga sp.]